VTIPHRGSGGTLHLLVDNEALTAIGPKTMPNGLKVEDEGAWHSRKHGASKRRVSRKIHLGIDEERLEIRAVEVTSGNVGDAAGPARPVPAGGEDRHGDGRRPL